METIDRIFDPCNRSELDALEARADRVLALMQREDREYRVPVIFEFTGSPKAGKSTIIGIVCHFFRRAKFRIGQPAEGASLRLPPDLKDDWLAFNTWSAAYALTTILEDCHAGDPDELVILDRGLFDATAWMHYLASQENISVKDRDTIVSFLTLDLWRQRQAGVFLFVADHATSLFREKSDKISTKTGRAMNKDVLNELLQSYAQAANSLQDLFHPVVRIDTSFVGDRQPCFQRIAYEVTNRMLRRLEDMSVQELLVTDPIDATGMITDESTVNATLEKVVQNPRFVPRDKAEGDIGMQQLVPYALLSNSEGKYLRLRRRTTGERKELAGKLSILVGGHAERKDWTKENPGGVFEQCLRREVSEEIIGLSVNSLRRLGLINDVRNNVGSKHLAVVYQANVGGTAAVRRQTADKEFGRESLVWKSPAEICAEVDDLDPWSQLVASKFFGAKLRDKDSGPSLFVKE